MKPANQIVLAVVLLPTVGRVIRDTTGSTPPATILVRVVTLPTVATALSVMSNALSAIRRPQIAQLAPSTGLTKPTSTELTALYPAPTAHFPQTTPTPAQVATTTALSARQQTTSPAPPVQLGFFSATPPAPHHASLVTGR